MKIASKYIKIDRKQLEIALQIQISFKNPQNLLQKFTITLAKKSKITSEILKKPNFQKLYTL